MKLETNSMGDEFLGKLRRLGFLTHAIGLLIFSLMIAGVGIMWLLDNLGVDQYKTGAIASQLGIGLYALMLFGFKKEVMSSPFKELSFKTFWYGVRATVIILIINVIVSGLLMTTEGMPESTQAIVEQRSFLLTFLLPVIVAPVFEEIAFRAGLKHLLVDQGGWSKAAYVIMSSIIFGMLHWSGGPSSVAHVVLTALIGVLYSLIYLKTENIYIPIASHMLYNGLVITAASFI